MFPSSTYLLLSYWVRIVFHKWIRQSPPLLTHLQAYPSIVTIPSHGYTAAYVWPSLFLSLLFSLVLVGSWCRITLPLAIFLTIPQHVLYNATRPFQKGQNIHRSLLKYLPKLTIIMFSLLISYTVLVTLLKAAWAVLLMVTHLPPKNSGLYYGHFPFPFHLSISWLLFHSFCTE